MEGTVIADAFMILAICWAAAAAGIVTYYVWKKVASRD